MKKATLDLSIQGLHAREHLGYNLLSKIKPTIFDKDGNKPPMKRFMGAWDENAHHQLILPFDADHHIDVFANEFTVLFDLGEVIEADGAFFSGESRGGDYLLGNYELFASQTKEDLFNDENRLIEVENEGLHSKMGDK